MQPLEFSIMGEAALAMAAAAGLQPIEFARFGNELDFSFAQRSCSLTAQRACGLAEMRQDEYCVRLLPACPRRVG